MASLILLCSCVIAFGNGCLGLENTAQADFNVKVNDAKRSQILRSYSLSELKSLKWRKKAQLGQYQSLKEWIWLWAEGMSAEESAMVDLIVLESKDGRKAFMPRWVTQKYDLYIVRSAEEPIQLRSVVPTQAFPRLANERLPLDSYQLSDIVSIELTNYQKYYGLFQLKKRTDPAAARGEKLFLQTCLGCHGIHQKVESQSMRMKINTAEAFVHKAVPGLPKLEEKDIRALKSYIRALPQIP